MTVIFSSERIEGLEGVYATPALATMIDFSGASLVYTDNKRLIALAKEANIQVRDFPKHPPTGKVEKTITPPKADIITPANDGPLVMTPVTGDATYVPEPVTPIEVTEVVEAPKEVVEAPKKRRTRKPRVKKDN